MKTLQDDKCSDKTRKTTEVRMGHEVPVIKKAGCCDSEKDAECSDKKEKKREDVASSLV
jgi:hypothetical protein